MKVKCKRCGAIFEDKLAEVFIKKNMPNAVRIYCDKCVDELWREK